MDQGGSPPGSRCLRLPRRGFLLSAAPDRSGPLLLSRFLAGIVQTVGFQSSKLTMRVRVPLPAPRSPHATATPPRRPPLQGTAPIFEPILRGGSPSATRCVRVRLPLGSPGSQVPQADHDGLVTLDCLISSPHRVRFAGDPLHDLHERRWQSSDCACMTSRRRQVRSLRAARFMGSSPRGESCLAHSSFGRDSRRVHRSFPFLRFAAHGSTWQSAPFGSERLEVQILLRRLDMPMWPNWQRP